MAPTKLKADSFVPSSASNVQSANHQLREDADCLPLSEEKGLIGLGTTIPGYSIPLSDPSVVNSFLTRELSTARLGSLYRILFLVSNRRNISPLHHQLVKDRDIRISERPDHHLVWHYGRIFIKPLPKFLLSHEFWGAYLNQKSEASAQLSLEAKGFLRSYSRLIVYESDFDLAMRLRLIPEIFTWPTWCAFIAAFQDLRDKDVAPRYHFGEIRLTRLNFLHLFLFGRSYSPVVDHYATFFSQFGGPYLFVLAAITVMLTALQTGLDAGLQSYSSLASWLVPLALGCTILLILFFPAVYLMFLLRELYLFIVYYQPLS